MTVPDPANPFGPQLPRGGQSKTVFPEARLRAVGASQEDIDAVRAQYDQASPEAQRAYASSVGQVEDEYVLSLTQELARAGYSTHSRTIDEVQADVSTDPALARHALRSEQDRGGKARKTLVSHLEDIVEQQDKAVQEQRDKVTAEGLTPEALEESQAANEQAATQQGDPNDAARQAPPLAAVQEDGGKVVPAEQAEDQGEGE
jgi:hypothetical protein